MTLQDIEKTKEGIRFFARVNKTDTCWLWNGCKDSGYGIVRDGRTRKNVRAHYWLKRRVEGDRPQGTECCHTCNVRACVNPEHIYYGTRKQNMQDLVRAGNHNWQTPRMGEKSPVAIFTDAQVLEILRIHREEKIGLVKIANRLGVNRNAINNILYNKKRWKHLKIGA